MGSASMLEEFFVAPRDAPTDSVIYFPMVGDGGEGGGGDGVLGRGATQPQYGLQLHVANLMQAPPGAPTFPPLQHVRSGASVPQVRPRVSPAESLSRSHLTCWCERYSASRQMVAPHDGWGTRLRVWTRPPAPFPSQGHTECAVTAHRWWSRV